MDSIAVSDLRANFKKILKKIEHGSIIDITSRGKVIAKLVPPDYSREIARQKLIELRENAVIGDVISPLNAAWEAAQD
ncbi:MAG TPA: type II toxin-antitoxin system prevent-host-death family antitoxin [bacterium]|nr:type II toxin-antitoxin system prevent-host-death family antitoxin [bacterium]HPN44832.1 type II toxin-antitoxin system prevent-host-death family antitoxin [bacterium]